MTNIQEETFEILEINDIETLFSNGRINRKEVPAGFFVYDIRYDDEGENLATIEPQVTANHAGTIITRQEIPMTCESYTPIEDYNFTGEETTLQEWHNQ